MEGSSERTDKTEDSPEKENTEGDSITLLEMKKNRIQIERDAQLLANRISLLKQEELKTQKKIAETKKKADEIMSKKIKNEEKFEHKSSKRDKEMRDLQQTKEEKFRIQKQRQEIIKKNKDYMVEENKKGAVERKKTRKHNDERIVLQHMEAVKKNQDKQAQVKRTEEMGRYNKNLKVNRKLQENKYGYDHRINKEEGKIKVKEQELMKMELLESELIKRLQNTQQVQKDAFVELEKALNYQSPQKWIPAGSPPRLSPPPNKKTQHSPEDQSPTADNQLIE